MSTSDKKEHIIKVAEKLFAQKGFDGTSVRDIAEAAGVNVSMISYYFGSKEKLMEALIEERTNYIVPQLEQLVKDHTLSPFKKLEILIDDYIGRSLQRLYFYKIMISEQVMEKNSIVSAHLKNLKKRQINLLEELIAEGQKKGVFKKKVDVLLMMNTMIGTVTQSFIGQEYYKIYNGLEKLSEQEFQDLLKKKLSTYIKELFKSILQYEA